MGKTYRISTPEKVAAARAAMDQIDLDRHVAEENLKMLREKWREARDEWVLLDTLWRGYSEDYKAKLQSK